MSPRLFRRCTCGECNITGGSWIEAGASIEGVRIGAPPPSTLRAEYCPPDKKGGRRYKKFAKPRLVATIRCAAGRAAEHGRRSNLDCAATPSKRWRCAGLTAAQHDGPTPAPPGGHSGKFCGKEEAAEESCSLPPVPISLRHPAGHTPVASARGQSCHSGAGAAGEGKGEVWERREKLGSDSERIGEE